MLIIVIICIRFMLPPCVLNVTLDLIYCLRASAACLRTEGVVNILSRNSAGVFELTGSRSVSRAWFEATEKFAAFTCVKATQNCVGTRTVRMCRYCAPTHCRIFPLVYRGTGTLLYNVEHL